jgi:hypothetical protein
MQILANMGFTKVKSIGTRKWAYVLLVHPNTVIERLREKQLVPDAWWEAYRDRQAVTGEIQPMDPPEPDPEALLTGVSRSTADVAPATPTQNATAQVASGESDGPF